MEDAGGEIVGLKETKPLKEAKPKVKKKPGRKKGSGFKLTRFDRDLAGLVKNGITDVPTILQKMAVDAEDFNARLNALVKKGFFVFDAATRFSIHLGWRGYNLFAPKIKPKQAKPPSEEQPRAEENVVLPIEKKEDTREFTPPPQTSFHILPAPQTTTDLADLLEKGSPKNNPGRRVFEERQQQKKWEKIDVPSLPKPTQIAKADTGKALILEGVEACELCKAKFKLNVKNTEQAKFGHCFCGAAFHKDCYESLSETGGECVRCGRKLKLMFGKKAEDAVRGLKDVFG